MSINSRFQSALDATGKPEPGSGVNDRGFRLDRGRPPLRRDRCLLGPLSRVVFGFPNVTPRRPPVRRFRGRTAASRDALGDDSPPAFAGLVGATTPAAAS